MVPSDFRLPNVANGLITRLEGTRRSYADDLEGARREFTRIADAHVEAACAELRELMDEDEVDAHAAFLRAEIHQTFLPRYLRLSSAMTRQEVRNFGLGPAGEPLGRAGLALGAVLGLVVFLRFIYLPWAWPLFLVVLSLPFWPDIARMLVRRRYAADLQEVVDDLDAVQQQATAFAPSTAAEKPRPRPRRESQ